MHKLTYIGLCALFLFPRVNASPLSEAAAALPERTWVKLPSNASLNGLDIPYSLLYWADSGGWDPIRRRFTWVGNSGSCCGDAIYKMLTFQEEDNTWSVSTTPFSGSGHSYDGNTLNPSTGDHYFTIYNSKQVRKWDGQTWTSLPDLPYGAVPAMAAAWFPDINNGQGGLIHVSGNGLVAWYNGTAWTPLSGAQTGDYNVFAEYNPVHKVVWLGAGNGSDRVNYKLDSDLNLTKMGDAPLSLNVGTSIKSVDPVGGNYIVSDITNGDIWEFDIAENTWSPLTGMEGDVPDMGGENPWLHVPITNHGVILYLYHYHEQRDLYLYRHTAGGTSSAAPEKHNRNHRLTISTDPVHSTFTLTLPKHMLGGQVDLFSIDGRRVSGMQKSAGIFKWNTQGYPAGLYLVRVSHLGSILTERILISN